MLLMRPSLVAAWTLALCACSGAGEPDAGADAGQDAGRDAGRDGGRDAGRDGGPNDPGWVLLPDAPANCPVERATRPEVLWQPEWRACRGAPTGCFEEVPPPNGTLVARTNVGWHDGEHGWLWVGTASTSDAAHTVSAISPLIGPPVAAWRLPESSALLRRHLVCQARVGLGDGYAAMNVHYYSGMTPSESIDLLYHASLEQIGALDTPTAVIDGPRFGDAGNLAQNISVSRDLVAMEMQPGGFIAVARGSTVQILEGGAARGVPQNLAVLGDQVLWEDWADLVRVVHASLTQLPEVFLAAAPGDVKGFGSDGSQLAWVQGYDRPPGAAEYARLELWTAPAVSSPSAVTPRFVRLLEQRPPAVGGGGWYVMLRGTVDGGVDGRYLEVTSLADGTQRRWTPTGYLLSQGATYASENEILVTVNGGYTLLRIDPHSLPLAP